MPWALLRHQGPQAYIRFRVYGRSPHQVRVTIGDKDTYNRVLSYPYNTTLTAWGVHLSTNGDTHALRDFITHKYILPQV